MTEDETDTDDERPEADEIEWAEGADTGDEDSTEERVGSVEGAGTGDEESVSDADVGDDETSPSGDDEEVPPLTDDDENLDEMESAFDERSTEEIEADEVWEDIVEDDETDDGVVDEPDDEILDEPDDGEIVGEPEDGEALEEQVEEEIIEGADVAEVSKHSYCERCRFFSGPPDIQCTHEGTEILDFTDMETVRVSDCPIVVERKGLEQGVARGSTDLGEIERDE